MITQVQVKWEELSEIIHRVKSYLVNIVMIEHLCKKLKEEIGQELDKINEIILEQKNIEEKLDK